jgi:hypothetical protein
MSLKSARGFFWFAALAGVVLVLLHESLFSGKGLVPADALLRNPPWNRAIRPSNYLLADQYHTFLPTQEFVHQQKSFPLWDPDLCCGAPNLGSIQGALLFPIRLLLAPLGPFYASGPAAFLKVCLAGWFMMLYAGVLGVSRSGAFLAGLVFSLSGFMIVWLGHPHVNCAMWMPLLFYFVEKTFRHDPGNALSPSALRSWAGFAVAFSFMILGGHPPTAVHVTIILVIYFIFRLAGRPQDHLWQRLGLLAGSVAVGLLLAAPQILPYLEYYQQSSSALASASLRRWSSHLDLSSLIHFLLPNIMGNPAVGFEDLPRLLGWHEIENFNERTGYVGILPLFLAACSIALRRCKFVKFFTSLAIGSLLVVYGIWPFPALMRMLPVLSSINHMRLLLVAGFSVAVLAGFGWDEVFMRRTAPQRTWIIAGGFCAVVGLALFCFWVVIGPNLRALDPVHWAFFVRQLLILGAGMVAVLLLALWPVHWKSWVPTVVCLGWTAADLLCFGMGYNPSISRDLYYPETPAIEFLQKDRSEFRIFGPGNVLPPNSAEVFGLSDMRGCDFMTVRRYEELITGHAGAFFFYQNPGTFPPTFGMLNAKYFLSPAAAPLNPQLFELIYAREIFIYRFKDYLDRALLVFDYQVEPDRAATLNAVASPDFNPRRLLLLEDQPPPATMKMNAVIPAHRNSSVQIVSYEPDDVKIDAVLSRPGYLLLLDTYFPGWSATVNGESSPVLRADYNFRAVSLPAGKSTVSFSYRPASLRIGLYLFAAGALAVGAALSQPWKTRRKEPH